MSKNPKRKRLEPYYAPASAGLDKLLEDEAAAIARGETAGLDPTKLYMAVRAVRDRQLVWLIAESPFDPKSLDGNGYTVMFVASLTFASAVYLMKAGAQMVGTDTQ